MLSVNLEIDIIFYNQSRAGYAVDLVAGGRSSRLRRASMVCCATEIQEIALAEQSAPVLGQEGISLKHRKTSEGHTDPPERTQRRQIASSTKLGRALALEVSGCAPRADLHQVA